ncbi:MAG TPA: dihydrolipoamide acetyltransferase family protein [Actinomycetes bacterium]|nr:dihydrolipoamide acetyltransferase family protein [Actinomycetes bacterium]
MTNPGVEPTVVESGSEVDVKTFLLPDLGEGLTEGEVLRWLVKEGDVVAVNQPVVEIETAKAAVELPCPFAGVIEARHGQEGDLLAVGTPLLTVRTTGSSGTPVAAVAEPVDGSSGPVLVGYGVSAGATRRRSRLAAPSPHGTQRLEAGPPGEPVKPVRHGGLEIGRAAEARFGDGATESTEPVLAKPPVRKLARELGVDLRQVRATGPNHTVTREDVKAAAALATPLAAPVREPVRGVVRAMADAMTRSAFTIPHVTEWVEADVTRSVEVLDRLRKGERFSEIKLTPLVLIARACIAALERSPMVNAAFDADLQEIVHHSDVNLGIAAATPRGLVVPNIKAAQALSLPELASALGQLSATAKAGHTQPAEMLGGTFTITNVGVFGVDGGTPIINPGEAAILAVGAWREKPWVHAGQVVPRIVTTLSLSFDHRFIDGAAGSRFLRDIADLLEEPAADLAW